ncbi:hypothetical protein D1007_22020 [Hordeum vulgare]|nr:hypothetical protein D1007_22020 [Hordeum vulgare]
MRRRRGRRATTVADEEATTTTTTKEEEATTAEEAEQQQQRKRNNSNIVRAKSDTQVVCGKVITSEKWDHVGEAMACVARFLPNLLNPLHSQMLAVEAALHLASDLGMGRVYMETDALLLKEALDDTVVDLSCLVLLQTA